jgi:hypothetical protein
MSRNHHKIKPRVVVMAAIISLVAAAGGASGEEPPTTTFEGGQEPNSDLQGTVQGYLRYAALNNADLKAAFEQWQTAAASVPNAKAILDPKLTYGYYIKEVETHTEQERQRVGVSQTFGLFGKKAAEESEAAAKAEAARLKYEEIKFRLFWEVKEAFYEYAYLTKATEITQEHLTVRGCRRGTIWLDGGGHCRRDACAYGNGRTRKYARGNGTSQRANGGETELCSEQAARRPTRPAGAGGIRAGAAQPYDCGGYAAAKKPGTCKIRQGNRGGGEQSEAGKGTVLPGHRGRV